MDQSKFKCKCPLHPDFQIEYLQVDNLSANFEGQKLFYCTECLDQDPNFKSQNYQLIKHIIKSGVDQILPKWPPVNDSKLISELIQVSKGLEETSIESDIQIFFKDLKSDILKQIDISQKKMIRKAQEWIEQKEQIMNKYQSLSKLKELRSILVNNQTDHDFKEEQCRKLVSNMISQKKTITEQFESLLKQQIIFNSESALQQKQLILWNLGNLEFFQSRNIISKNKELNKMKLDIQLIHTKFRDSQTQQEIIQNQYNESQLTIIKKGVSLFNWNNAVSNIVLSNDRKYVFRFSIKMSENETCQLGLMQSSNIDIQAGFLDKLCCQLQFQSQCILNTDNKDCGIGKQIKGQGFILPYYNHIEMRVSLRDQILEILDYPTYRYKIGLEDKFKSNLNEKKDLRLYLGIDYLNNRVTLKEAFTVDKFE